MVTISESIITKNNYHIAVDGNDRSVSLCGVLVRETSINGKHWMKEIKGVEWCPNCQVLRNVPQKGKQQ